jgi:hypothetical protein
LQIAKQEMQNAKCSAAREICGDRRPRKKYGWCPDDVGHQPYDECLNEVSIIVQSTSPLTSPDSKKIEEVQ